MGDYEQAVYVSYAWGGEREDIVNQIDQALQKRGIKIFRDKRVVGYKGSIIHFMERIGHGNCVIVVISDKYLRSPNCMFELIEIAENKQFYDRVFPIVLGDADIYDTAKRLGYVKHWEKEKAKLVDEMKGVDPANLQGIREDIDRYDRIRDKISGLTSILKDMNTLTLEAHQDSDFSSLCSAIEGRMKKSQGRKSKMANSTKRKLEKRTGKESVVGSASQSDDLWKVQILEGKDIFKESINYLKAQSRDEVLIYAPTGVWQEDKDKKRWFAAIAGCLARGSDIPQNRWPKGANKSVTTTLGHFIGVYGLPMPRKDRVTGQITEKELRKFLKSLDRIEELLMPFNELEAAELHYLETDLDNVPGTGAIIIDNSAAIGYAINTKHKVDYALLFSEEQKITTKIKNWFDYHVMDMSKYNVIQSMKHGKSVRQGMEAIRKHYRSLLKTQSI
jgi:hypothetical protein